jgi:biopolymer transport protein ExbD
MNVSNSSNVTTTTLQSDITHEPNVTPVILSIVMPILLVLFCVGYVAWDMEKSTRPEKSDETEDSKNKRQPSKLKSRKTLSIQPVQLESKETPSNLKKESLEVKSDTP